MTPITEEWLIEVGFKWHQVERQPAKHWVLWISRCLPGCCGDELGIEVTIQAGGSAWYCWLRSDVAVRYGRFIHLRMLVCQDELIRLAEGLTGQRWDPANHHYGQMWTVTEAARIEAEKHRLDRQFIEGRPAWREAEKDPTRGRALPEHLP